ncbi:stalk domain-containing protein [Paenibacillus alkalitolerans]|uniref:stalk domain-containing protein n=1 Tax=Paenibacillus alkalitolerans TaxID=2799335 RepID=UPI0018F3F0C6|nr:stalk domain-containing protein [Paenibacillus alkalitolerans]
MGMSKKFLLAAMLIVSLVTMIGCEAVGGVDVNKALLSGLDNVSSEGTFDFEWEIEADPAKKTDPETERMLQALGSGKLTMHEVKTEDASHASAKGTLSIPRGNVPFEVYLNEDRYIVNVEGAKAPYMFDISDLSGVSGAAFGELEDAGALAEIMRPASEQNRELMKAVASFLLANMPNPQRIGASQVTEELGGKTAALTKVSLEAGADEMAELTVKLLRNIVKDEKGLKDLLGTVYDIMKPVLEELNEKEGGTDPTLAMALRNKTLAVEFVYEMMKPVLHELSAELDANSASAVKDIGLSFGSGTSVKLDLLFDGMTPAGMDLNVVLTPPSDDNDGISSVRFAASSRQWNVGSDVKAEAYNGEVYEVKSSVKPRNRLDNVEKGSLLYELLKKDLKVNSHTFVMSLGEESGVTDGFSPYVKGKGTTMVPVRYVSEELDTNVEWNGKASTVTIRDAAENVTIVLKIGSKAATVNGMQYILPEAPERKFGTTFVPIAFITKALGGTAEWNGSGIVTITKEF